VGGGGYTENIGIDTKTKLGKLPTKYFFNVSVTQGNNYLYDQSLMFMVK
jgi:hypothetical protein